MIKSRECFIEVYINNQCLIIIVYEYFLRKSKGKIHMYLVYYKFVYFCEIESLMNMHPGIQGPCITWCDFTLYSSGSTKPICKLKLIKIK